MQRPASQRRALSAVALSLLVATGTLGVASPARAVGNETSNTVGKGLVGGALLGGEVVVLVEAALGVKPWWAYALGGGLGMVGGGIGGFVLGEANPDSALPMAMLTAGLIAVVPTTIAVLSATAYSPDADVTQEKLARLRLAPPTGFVAYRPNRGLDLALPAVSVSEVFSPREKVTYALPTTTEVRALMFSAEF